MDIRQLDTFVQVVNNKSFSKAAKKLFLSQPSVTSHIQALEEEYGTVLLNRFGRSVTTTGAGEILYNRALEILNMVSITNFDLSSYKGKVQGHLRISASSIPRNYMIPNLLKTFIEVYPDISFSVIESDSKKIIDSVLDGDTDFGIVGANFPNKYIDYIKLVKDRICIITPNNDDFPYENFSYISKDKILSKNIILREKGSGTRHLIETLFLDLEADRSFEKNTSYVEDNEAIKKFVKAMLGIGFISECAILEDVKKGTLKAFYLENFDFERNFYFAYHNKRELSPLSKHFKNFILNEDNIL